MHVADLTGITLYPAAFDDADALLASLEREVRPQLAQRAIHIGGREIPEPRLTAWFGDAGATYTYSGRRNTPQPWPPSLTALRQRLDRRLGTQLNSVLVNHYRDGRDSIGWHADDEPELRDRIVSLSFGATRTFYMRKGRTGTSIALPLPHGSVLVMTVAAQRHYQHAVQKELNVGARWNLTFRTCAT